MAVTAREVIMIFRGQNYLSSAIRRVSADVQGLTRIQQLGVQRALASANVARLRTQRTAIEQELASVRTGGARRLAVERDIQGRINSVREVHEKALRSTKAIAAANQAYEQSLLKVKSAESAVLALQQKQAIEQGRLAAQAQLASMRAAAAPGRVPALFAADPRRTQILKKAATDIGAIEDRINSRRLAAERLINQAKGKAMVINDAMLKQAELEATYATEIAAAQKKLADTTLLTQKGVVGTSAFVTPAGTRMIMDQGKIIGKAAMNAKEAEAAMKGGARAFLAANIQQELQRAENVVSLEKDRLLTIMRAGRAIYRNLEADVADKDAVLSARNARLANLQASIEQERVETAIAAKLKAESDLTEHIAAVRAGATGLGVGNVTTVADLRARVAAAEDEADMAKIARAEAIRKSREVAADLRFQVLASDAVLARRTRLNQVETQLAEKLKTQGIYLTQAELKLKQMDAMIAAQPWVRLQQGARTIEHMSRVLNMLGLIAGATFGYMAKSAADFNTQMRVAATQTTTAGNNTVQAVIRNAKQIGDAITQLLAQGKTIAKPEELSQSIYDIFSGVTFKGNQQTQLKSGIALLKEFNQVVTANAGLVTMNEATQAGITLINDFDIKLKDMPRALNIMQAAVRYGRMTMSQFLSTFNQAAPAAKSAGYSFTQMADAITFLSRKFPSIRFAATGYARLVEILGRSTKAFKEHGVVITDAHNKLLPLDVIVNKLATRWPQLAKGGNVFFQNFFKAITGQQATTQARKAFVFIEQGRKRFGQLSGQVNKDSNELNRSLKSVEKSSGVTWSQFINQLRAVVLEIGAGAIPAFRDIGKYVEAAIKWFNDLSPSTRRTIGYLGALVAVLVTVGSTLSMAVGGIMAMTATFVIWAKLRGAVGGTANQLMLLARANEAASISAAQLGEAEGRAALASEAGFIRVGRLARLTSTVALGAGIPVALILLYKYHKQVLEIANDLGGWRQALAAITAAFAVMNIQRMIVAFTQLSLAMKALTVTSGILLLVAAFMNFAHAGDIVRNALDALFSTWAGYLITIAAMTTALYKLRTALIELKVVEAGASLWSGLAALGPGIVRGIKTATGAATATRTVGQAAAASGIVLPAAVATEEAAVGATAGIAGLTAATAAFIPMLAAGGALATGLYLWKKHLDSVREATERMARAQAYLKQVASAEIPLQNFSKIGDNVAAQERASIQFRAARKAYDDALKQNVHGDALKTLALDLYDASRGLAQANAALAHSTRAYKELVNLLGENRQTRRLQTNITNLKNLIKEVPNLSVGTYDLKRGVVGGAEGKQILDLEKRFKFSDISGAKRALANQVKLLADFTTELDKTRVKFTSTARRYVQQLSQLNLIPNISPRLRSQVAQWITDIHRIPTTAEIKMFVRVAMGLSPDSSGAPIAARFRQDIINKAIQDAESNRNKKLTHRQLKILVRVLFGIDPNSDGGKKLQAIIQGVINSAIKNVKPTIDLTRIPGGLGAAVAGLVPVPMPHISDADLHRYANQGVKAAKDGSKNASKIVQTQAQIDAKNLAKIDRETAELGRLYRKASLSKSSADWLAFERLNKKYSDEWSKKGSEAENAVFNQMLQYQEDATKKSGKKRVTINTQTFQDMLAGIKNMYDGFLQQEQGLFGTLFQGPNLTGPAMQYAEGFGYVPTGQDVAKDYAMQIAQFTKFHKEIDKLSSRIPKPLQGIREELRKQLTALGPEAMPQIEALLKLPASQLRGFFANFQKGQKLIKDQTMKDLNAQLKIYRSHGQNIAKAIITGIQDENVALTKVFSDMIRRLFPGLPVGATGAGGKATHGKYVPKTTKAAMGMVVPGIGHGDTVHAMLTPKEIVFNRRHQKNLSAMLGKSDTTSPHELFHLVNNPPQSLISGGIVNTPTRQANTVHHTHTNTVRQIQAIRHSQTVRNVSRSYSTQTVRDVQRVMPAIRNTIRFSPVVRNPVTVKVSPVVYSPTPRTTIINNNGQMPTGGNRPTTQIINHNQHRYEVEVITSNNASADTQVRHGIFAATQRYRGSH